MAKEVKMKTNHKTLKVKETLINLGLLSFFVLLGLIIVEIYLRYTQQQQHQALVQKYQEIEKESLSRKLCAQASKTPGLIYEIIPNQCGANSHGYFDNEYSYEKAPETKRIVVIGDSIAQGLGLDQEADDTFGKRLERQLNSDTDQNIEVIVLAVTGYSTSQELIVLQEQALKYDPDLIIWSYVFNDPAHPIYHNANGELGRYFYQPKIQVAHLLSKGFFSINEAIKAIPCDKEYHQHLHCVYWDEISANLNQIGDISQSNNIPVIFLIHPIFEDNNDFSQYSLLNIHQKLTEAADKAGLISIDLLNVFEQYPSEELKLQPQDPWHPNEEGHQIIADVIEDYLGANPTFSGSDHQ